MKKKLETYRVWVSQVNATYLDVKASDEEDAKEKGYRKWKREYAGSHVSAVEKQEP